MAVTVPVWKVQVVRGGPGINGNQIVRWFGEELSPFFVSKLHSEIPFPTSNIPYIINLYTYSSVQIGTRNKIPRKLYWNPFNFLQKRVLYSQIS